MCLQFRRKYHAVLDENIKLKEGQSGLPACLEPREEVEERGVKVQEDREEKSKDLPLQSKYIETFSKAIETQSIDSNVSDHTLVLHKKVHLFTDYSYSLLTVASLLVIVRSFDLHTVYVAS